MSLSEFSYYVRRFGPIALIGFVLFIIFFMIVQAIIGALLNRPVEVVYEPKFGILEPINFTYKVDYPPTFTMTLNNVVERPVTATSSAMVYFIPAARARFGYQQTAALMARAVGINTEQERYVLNDTTATYNDGLRTLSIDITNYNFTYELDYLRTPGLFDNAIVPSESVIREEAKAFLRQMNKLPPALSQGQENIIYMRYDPFLDDFEVVDTPVEANVVEVDFFTPQVNDIPAVTPQFHNSSNFVTIVFRPEGNVIMKSQISYFEKDFNEGGPYPLKTGDQAWAELQNGRGVIVSPSLGSTDIVVRDMFLAYYEPAEYQQYYMPVYVFLGDNGFAAYVSAIESGYIEGEEPFEAVPPAE